MLHWNLPIMILGVGVAVFLAEGGSARASQAGAGKPAPVEKEFACKPTPGGSLGPFYEPDAPLRDSVGEGYVLKGAVRSAVDCSALSGGRIEFWLAGPDGKYDDEHRATIVTTTGEYRFDFPPLTGPGRPTFTFVCRPEATEPLSPSTIRKKGIHGAPWT